jgi:ABC-2 type transport system permease protein
MRATLGQLRRYGRLWFAMIRFSWARSLEFRIDFWFRFAMDLVFYAMNLLLFHVIFIHSPRFGGLTREQAMVFVASYLFVDGIRMTFFVDNFRRLRQMVAMGQFDLYLTKPASTLFLSTLREFSLSSLGNLVIASGILVWALTSLPRDLSTVDLLRFGLLIANGVVIYYVLHLFFTITVFWTHSPEGIESVLYVIKRFGERPHTIFPTGVQMVLRTIIPVGLIGSVPAFSLFVESPWLMTVQACSVTLVLSWLAAIAWRRALEAYSSASS